MNLSIRSAFLFTLLFLAIVVTTSGCFFDYSTARTGKITYETYENSMLKLERLD
ncbi:MAG TPA: hypothetical protein VHR47_01335 [Bacillota bacterium]|nr:hypothetical protein [Bacillota bacterium]